MTRAIISATEAKTAVLQDLDIRSAYSSLYNQATGTGTDNIIVIQGTGIRIDNAGGHSKLGELIAKAVYAGVQESIYKQNGIVNRRNVFQRLKDRKISIYRLVSEAKRDCIYKKSGLGGEIEEILLDPRYAGFIEASFAISDSYERGLICDLSGYELWCNNVAEEIAGKKIAQLSDIVETDHKPVVLRMALNAILNGLCSKMSCNR